MKIIFYLALTFSLIISLTACGGNSDKPIINDNAEIESNQNIETSESDNTSDIKDAGGEEDDDDEVYNNKIYYVGDDIAEGNYVVNCTTSEYGMDIVVFQSELEYAAFQNAEQFTVGEYRSAIEQNAWISLYIEVDESVYIGLKEGNIILLDGGMCEFNNYDAIESNVLYPGIYVVGEDIVAGNLDIKGTTDYLQVVVFASVDKYCTYHKTDRSTIGEESDAIEANASSSYYIYGDDTASVKLEDGMVLLIADGIGEYSVDEGPVIK